MDFFKMASCPTQASPFDTKFWNFFQSIIPLSFWKCGSHSSSLLRWSLRPRVNSGGLAPWASTNFDPCNNTFQSSNCHLRTHVKFQVDIFKIYKVITELSFPTQITKFVPILGLNHTILSNFYKPIIFIKISTCIFLKVVSLTVLLKINISKLSYRHFEILAGVATRMCRQLVLKQDSQPYILFHCSETGFLHNWTNAMPETFTCELVSTLPIVFWWPIHFSK